MHRTLIALLAPLVVLVASAPAAAQRAPLVLRIQGEIYPAAEGTFTTPIAGLPGGVLNGLVVWTGGDGCRLETVPAASRPQQIALFQRGDCFFTTKAQHALAQGYAAFIVANHAGNDAVITMGSPDDGTVAIPGLFVGHATGNVLMRLSPHGAMVVQAATS